MRYKFEKPVRGTIGSGKYRCTIKWSNGEFIEDEPETSGGKDTGSDAYTILLSSHKSVFQLLYILYFNCIKRLPVIRTTPYTGELPELYEPIKTANEQNILCMTTWCVQKSGI